VAHFLPFLIVPLMFATLGVLFAGLIGVARGGDEPRRSNRLMRWRVLLQAAALLLFLLMLGLRRG
jgi:Hypoxia induced protein conserved region